MEAIQEQLILLLAAIVVGIVGVIGESIRKWLNAKFNKEQLQQGVEITNIAVKAIEQVSETIGVEDKFNSAKKKVVSALNEKKIKISEEQIDLLIEAAVSEMNKQIKEGKQDIYYSDFNISTHQSDKRDAEILEKEIAKDMELNRRKM